MYRRCIMGDRKNTSLDKDSPEVNRRLTVKYTKEERLDIGRRIYDGEISRYQAAEIYDISEQTARDYMRLYRDAEQLPPKRAAKNTIKAPSFQTDPAGMEELESMTKERNSCTKKEPSIILNNPPFGLEDLLQSQSPRCIILKIYKTG